MTHRYVLPIPSRLASSDLKGNDLDMTSVLSSSMSILLAQSYHFQNRSSLPDSVTRDKRRIAQHSLRLSALKISVQGQGFRDLRIESYWLPGPNISAWWEEGWCNKKYILRPRSSCHASSSSGRGFPAK